jgi:hypothetical protein
MKSLIDHHGIGLRPDVIAELRLDHRVRCLDVTPLVIVTQVLVPIQVVEVIHLREQPAASGDRVGLLAGRRRGGG